MKIGSIIPAEEVYVTSAQPKTYGPIELKDSKLTLIQQKQLLALLNKYKEAFATHENDIGKCKVIKHKIDPPNTTPIRQRAYRLPRAQQEEQAQILQNMINSKTK